MNKHTIIERIIAALAADLAIYTHSARDAFAAATDEQSKSEGKYDTRAIESSYLARGQSLQAAEIIRAVQDYEKLALRDFGPGEPIHIGALVELERKTERTFYFIGPRAGGTTVQTRRYVGAGARACGMGTCAAGGVIMPRRRTLLQ